MLRFSILVGIALGLALSAWVIPAAPYGQQISGNTGLRARWGSTPGLPPSGGYCADD